MKRPASIVLVSVAMVVLVVSYLLARHKPEPVFNGKPLSYWMFQSVADYPRRNKAANEALQKMGQPAVEALTEAVEREDSFLRKQIAKHDDLIPILNRNIPSKYWYRWLAAHALRGVGTNGASAIPALEKMSLDSDKILSSNARATLLLVKGEPIEKLVTDYQDRSNRTNYAKAFGILLQLGPYAEAAIPILLAELQSTNSRIRSGAVTLLGSVGVESEVCVAAMTNLLNDPDSLIRSTAANALVNAVTWRNTRLHW